MCSSMGTYTAFGVHFVPRNSLAPNRTSRHLIRAVHLTARSVWSDVRALVFPRVSITNEIVKAEARVARSARPLKVGALRPAIVLYGEPHPLGDDIGCIQTADLAKKPDMLIIMGTSLKVHGLKRLVRDFARVVHESAPSVSSPRKKTWAGKVVFVNRTPPSTEWADVIDYHVAGDTDKWATKVLEDWKKMRPADWEIQQTLVGADAHGSAALKVVAKSGTSKAKGSCFQLHIAYWSSQIYRCRCEKAPSEPGEYLSDSGEFRVHIASSRK